MTFTIPASRFHARLEDGREWTVETDQRDQRRVMLTLGIDQDVDGLGFLRAITWAALVRTGQVNGMRWPDFDDACTWCVPDHADDDATVDPTAPAGAGS